MMKNINYNDFWESCAEAYCVVAPIKLYSTYNPEGNLSDKNLIGIKYVAFQFDNGAPLDDFYVDIEERTSDTTHIFDTPEEALWDFMNRTALFQKRLTGKEDKG